MTSAADSIFPQEYNILKKLGQGGTADVYLAQRQGCSLPVALKLFHDHQAGHLIQRELEIAGCIRFPGLVRIKRKCQARDGRLFLEAEYCPGPTLDSLAGRVNQERLLSILSSLSCALYVLHQAGYSYNDLKAGNIFVPQNFDTDTFPLNNLFYLKLNDFSLAKKFDEQSTKNVTGTVGYMSPEMILKKHITPASDIFSLGVLAYYLACGIMPFTSDDNDPVKINALVTEGPRPDFNGPGDLLPDELKKLIHRLLAIVPSNRFSSAFELIEELARQGSPYPYRKAVRPRHLIGHHNLISPEELNDIFGKGSFSNKQLNGLEKMTGFEIQNLQILLDYNFEIGNFARLDGRWGWRNERAEAIKWPDRLSKFNLRLLKNKPMSFKQLVMALALVEDDSEISAVADLMSNYPDSLITLWQQIPQRCKLALLYSTQQSIGARTRRIISQRLIPVYENKEEYTGLLGRLFYYAGHFEKAVESLTTTAQQALNNTQNDLAIELIDLAFAAATHLGDDDSRSEISLTKAMMLKELGLTQDSEAQYHKALELLQNIERKDLLARAYKELGDVYKVKADYKKGIEVLNKALAIYRQINDQLELSHTLNNLGNIFWMSGDLEKALDHYQQALEIQNDLDSDKDIASSLSNIGSIYVIRGNYDSGIDYLNRSLSLKEKLGDKREIARTLNNLGVANFLAGEMSSAIDSYLRSLEYNRKIDDKQEQLLNIENLAEAMTHAGRVRQALDYIREGLNLADEEKSDFHRSDLTRLTGQLLQRMGNYDEAELNLQKALEISKNIDNSGLQLACSISMIKLHINLREFNRTAGLITEGFRLANRLGDKNALFYLNLIQFDLKQESQYLKTAEELVEELNSPRDSAQLNLSLLEQANLEEDSDRAATYLQIAQSFFMKGREDIDQARFHLASGHYNFLVSDYDRAESLLKKALALAEKSALLPEQWQIQALLSELAFTNNAFEPSFQYAQNTLKILKQISKQITDRERLGRFYNDQRIIDLLGRIKSLQSVLGNKKGAAVSNP